MGKIKLDLKDRRILTEMSLNARQPVASIAKKVGLSKQVVKYRLENLEQIGLIEGYYAILNINKLGYLYHRIFFKFRNVSPEKESEIIEFCRAHRRIGWIFQIYGDWDFVVAVWARDAVELSEVLDGILDRFGAHIEDKFISISIAIHHLKYKLFLEQKDRSELVMGGRVEEPELDGLDYNLIGILCKNARKSLLEIGEELNARPKVIKYRVDRLIKRGIVLGFNVKLNFGMLGYTHHKIFLNLTNLSQENVNKLISYLRSLPNSIYITKAVGVSDMEFEVLVESNKEFQDIMRELRCRFSGMIKNYSSFIIAKEPYINYLPMKT